MAAASSSSSTAEDWSRIVRRRHPTEDFTIDRKVLGKGSFGTVFKGVDKTSGLKVALKFSHNKLSASAMDGARDEAVMMQRVRFGIQGPRRGTSSDQEGPGRLSSRSGLGSILPRRGGFRFGMGARGCDACRPGRSVIAEMRSARDW